MLRFAMLAEQGCPVAVENMAWIAQQVLPVPPINPLATGGGCATPPSWWQAASQEDALEAPEAPDAGQGENIDGQQEGQQGAHAGHPCVEDGTCDAAPIPVRGPVRRKLPQSFRLPAFWTAKGIEARWWQRVLTWRLRAAEMGLVEGWIDAGHMLSEGGALGLIGGAWSLALAHKHVCRLHASHTQLPALS